MFKLFVITGHSSESVAFARGRGLLCPAPQLVLLFVLYFAQETQPRLCRTQWTRQNALHDDDAKAGYQGC